MDTFENSETTLNKVQQVHNVPLHYIHCLQQILNRLLLNLLFLFKIY